MRTIGFVAADQPLRYTVRYYFLYVQIITIMIIYNNNLTTIHTYLGRDRHCVQLIRSWSDSARPDVSFVKSIAERHRSSYLENPHGATGGVSLMEPSARGRGNISVGKKKFNTLAYSSALLLSSLHGVVQKI